MAQRGRAETYYMAKMILGYDKFTADCHGPLCTFLDTCTTKRRMEQMPRDHFKTTSLISHRIKNVVNNPALRILMVGDTGTNAQKHLAKIRGHFERNVLFRWLYPEVIWENPDAQAPAWSKEMLYLPTKALHGEPTFDTIGARGAAVSRHYDIINADDIIGESEYYSPTDMDRTTEWFTGLESLFAPPVDQCLMDIPCTFWRTDDTYAYAEQFYGHGQEPVQTGPYSFRKGEIAVFRRGAIENGKVIFPEGGFTMEFYNRLRQHNPERFAAQYANDPFASENTYFKKEYLRYYTTKIVNGELWVILNKPDGTRLELNVKEHLSIISMCDPHAGGSAEKRFRGSRAAVITTGVYGATGDVIVLDTYIQRVPTGKIVDEIVRQNIEWMPSIFSVETNGFQKMLRFWIEEREERDHLLPIPVTQYNPEGDKDGERRIKGLHPLFRAGQVWIASGMSELQEEYFAYPRGLKDGLDCLAQGLSYWNVGWDSIEQETLDRYEQAMRAMRNPVTGY